MTVENYENLMKELQKEKKMNYKIKMNFCLVCSSSRRRAQYFKELKSSSSSCRLELNS